MTDYKELCQELFGTIDEKKIREKFNQLSKPKKSGRKPIFDEKELEKISDELEKGTSVKELAAKYNTSRQVIGRYINKKSQDGYSVRLFYMYKQYPCTIIDVDYLDKKVKIQNRTDDIFHRAFGVIKNPTWDDYEKFLESRCYPKSRSDIKNILKILEIDSYDAFQIIKKTQGRTSDDEQWIKVYSN